jgi:hypothetical protein
MHGMLHAWPLVGLVRITIVLPVRRHKRGKRRKDNG